MVLTPKESAKLVNAALTPKTAAARMKASAKVLAAMGKIVEGPDLRWDAFEERFLRDCLMTGPGAELARFEAELKDAARLWESYLKGLV